MKYDIFLSICQTEVDGFIPSEKQMFEQFLDQVQLADRLGFEVAWVAESHLSCEVQKSNKKPVIPHFKGEIGLNTDILQLAHLVFDRTEKIHIGSAIRNILCNGGPIAHAEALKTFLTLHQLRQSPERKLYLGFAAGRFPFANEPYGIKPRSAAEELIWPALKGKVFIQATEIFLRLLGNETLAIEDISPIQLSVNDFRSEEDWQKAAEAFEVGEKDSIVVPSFWDFEKLGVVPFIQDLSQLQLVIGSHDPKAQKLANKYFPTHVFNLSITPGGKIEETHQRMQNDFHRDGGKWDRSYMPRTVLLFINGDPDLTGEQQSQKAREAAEKAIGTYWQAMEGTLDRDKVEKAVDNSIYGNPKEVAMKILDKYHSDDRLMLWFDLNNHDNEQLKTSMEVFMNQSVPLINNHRQAATK